MAPKCAPAKVKAQCRSIAKALEHVALPKEVRTILAGSVESTVGVLKAERHPFQDNLATMIGETLSPSLKAHKQRVAELAEEIAVRGAEKSARTAAKEAAEKTLEEKVAAAIEMKTAAHEGHEALRAAKAALADAERALKEGMAELAAVRGMKQRLDHLLSKWVPLKEGTSEGKKGIASELRAFSKDSDVDPKMIESVPAAIAKEPASHSTYDKFVIKEMDGEIAKQSESLCGSIASAEQGVQDRLATVELAKAAVPAAEATVQAAEQAREDSFGAEKEAQAALRGAEAAVDAFDHAAKTLNKAAEAAQKRLAEFEQGALKAFDNLQSATEDTPGRSFETIDGVQCDRAIVNVIRKAMFLEGGAGRVPEEAAKAFFEMIAASGDITRVDRWSIRYCLEEFAWTEAAHEFITQEMKKLPHDDAEEPASKRRKTKGYYITLDGVRCDSGIVDAVNAAVAGRGDGRVSQEDAEKVYEKMADGGKVTEVERWTYRYCLLEFKWTQAAKDWISAKLKPAVR